MSHVGSWFGSLILERNHGTPEFILSNRHTDLGRTAEWTRHMRYDLRRWQLRVKQDPITFQCTINMALARMSCVCRESCNTKRRGMHLASCLYSQLLQTLSLFWYRKSENGYLIHCWWIWPKYQGSLKQLNGDLSTAAPAVAFSMYYLLVSMLMLGRSASASRFERTRNVTSSKCDRYSPTENKDLPAQATTHQYNMKIWEVPWWNKRTLCVRFS